MNRLAPIIIAGAALLLAGCASAANATGPTESKPRPTVTVTASPQSSAARGAGDELDSLDAWDACFAVTFEKSQGDTTEWSKYDPGAVVKNGIDYTVTIHSVRGQSEQTGTDAVCNVAGRLGGVVVTDWKHPAN